jgi:hypothetical protein
MFLNILKLLFTLGASVCTVLHVFWDIDCLHLDVIFLWSLTLVFSISESRYRMVVITRTTVKDSGDGC